MTPMVVAASAASVKEALQEALAAEEGEQKRPQEILADQQPVEPLELAYHAPPLGRARICVHRQPLFGTIRSRRFQGGQAGRQSGRAIDAAPERRTCPF